jgi:hypothetical protein
MCVSPIHLGLRCLRALAPCRITDNGVIAWRTRGDAEPKRLIDFGAISAVTRIDYSICAVAGVAC